MSELVKFFSRRSYARKRNWFFFRNTVACLCDVDFVAVVFANVSNDETLYAAAAAAVTTLLLSQVLKRNANGDG